jgi:hypothetical protein
MFESRCRLRGVRLQAEYTVEPFVEGAPGPHVTAAFAAVRHERDR